MNTPPPAETDLHQHLRALQDEIRSASDSAPEVVGLLHRDAVYAALDVADAASALTHALAFLELARSSADASLQAKAHVAVGLVQAETYDDVGATGHFQLAEDLSREAGDDRGVALVAVNAAHFKMERGEYDQAVTRLQDLLGRPEARGLSLGDSPDLNHVFHTNYVISASEALMQGRLDPRQVPDVEHQLGGSAALLHDLNTDRSRLTRPVRILDVLDALTRFALWRADLPAALRLADERVRLARRDGTAEMTGRALLDRSRVHARSECWADATADAEGAVSQFLHSGHDLLAARAREALAQGYARTGRYREAFEVQQDVTRRLESLYLQYFQQRAMLGQLEQQARAAEVRAAAFREASLRDSLTGLPNRAFAMQVLTRLHAQATDGRRGVVALMDLDHFKHVNDTYGHASGDAVLVRVAEVLSGEIRPIDCFARFGGEEFAVILADVTPEEGVEACERLRRTLNDIDWSEQGMDLRVSGSFGVASLDARVDLTSILQAADRALYLAKAEGRNVLRVASMPDGPAS